MKRLLLYISFIVFSINTFAQTQAVFGIKKEYPAVKFSADGNSYPQGNSYVPFPTFVINHYPYNVNNSTLSNYAVGGQTTEDMLSDIQSQVISGKDPSKRNIALILEVTNDIYYYGSAVLAYNNIKLYCDSLQNAGFIVVLYTNIHRDQTTSFGDNPTQFNAKIDSSNVLIKDDPSFYDILIRLDEQPQFANYLTGYYDADKVHPNQAGQDFIGQLTLNALIYFCFPLLVIRRRKKQSA